MRVCILTTSFPAYEGHFQSPFILKLAESLADNGVEVDVVCPLYKEGRHREETINKVKVHRFQYLFPISLQRLYLGGGLPHNIKKSWLSRLELMPYLFFYLLKSIKYGKKADMLHAQWSLSGLVGVFVKKIYKRPLILSTRGIEVDIVKNNYFMGRMFRYILKNCDFITPNNVHHIAKLEELGVPKEKVLSVPNGVDVNLYRPRNKDRLRLKLGIKKDVKVILFVGWLIERKGVEYLIRSFPKVLVENKNAMLYIIGSGSLKKSLDKSAYNLKISNQVRILEPMPPKDVALWIAAADVFVLPSLAEGRPNVIYEAILSGVPVIATNIGGSNELIKDGKNGFLVEPMDSDAIAKKINLLLKNKRLSDAFAKKAREHISSLDVSWDDCAKKFISVYNKTLNPK